MAEEKILAKFEESTRNAENCQLELLRSILERNAGVRYLQSYLGENVPPLDVETYKRAVPLSYYEDYVDFINRMADGLEDRDGQPQPLLSVDPLVCFFYSSGTSSMKPKLIPFFNSTNSDASSIVPHIGGAVFRRFLPPKSSPSKLLLFAYAGISTTTRGSYEVMAASAYPFQSNKANCPHLSYISSPWEVLVASNVEQQMYCHLLCGLRNADLIDGIRAPYAVELVKVFCLLESKWEQLSDDLENGFPASEISDTSLRLSVIQVLGGPQLELSRRVRSICGDKDKWVGIVARLWPNARYIMCVSTGVMEYYHLKLENYAGEVPILGTDYIASECAVGINMDIKQPPEKTLYVMIPTSAYFEFLPFDSDKNQTVGEETSDISGVEVGKMYELVVTTSGGLYRYRLGDIVRVMGFHNSSPKIQFAIRAPKNPHEVTTERDLITAMEAFQRTLIRNAELEVIDFASFLEPKQKKLKIFTEIRDQTSMIWLQKEKLEETVKALERCCSSLEDGLGNLYKAARERGDVGPLKLAIVKSGTFDKLAKKAIENGTPASQYKPPKIIRSLEFVGILEGSVLITI